MSIKDCPYHAWAVVDWSALLGTYEHNSASSETFFTDHILTWSAYFFEFFFRSWKRGLKKKVLLIAHLYPIDWRCEDGRFPVSASCVTIPNPDSLSSSETGVNLGIRSWKKHWSERARCQKAIGGIYFTKKWTSETLQPGLEFENFKPKLISGIFKCISWLNG
jgi:hypothetical protein